MIDTADIDVSSPRIHSSSSCDRSRPRTRLRRDRPTVKIRSQALKNNPVLREHNERHEKSVGELLMEKFYIKDKKSDGEPQQIRLYHQINLDQDDNSDACEAIQKQVTRRFTRRRSSADIQLDPEQLQREITYAQVQAKLLDNLVAEEQAQIANEARQGTLIRKGTIRTPKTGSPYYTSNTDSDMSVPEDEKTGADKVTKATKKTKKKKRPTDNEPSPSDKILDNEQSNISNKISHDDAKIRKVEKSSTSGEMYKIEASNSAGDFSTIWINAAGNEKRRSSIEQFRESVKIPIPKKSLNVMDSFSETSKYSDEEETEIVLPVRKPYIKDLSRNSVYLTVKRSIEKLDNDAKDDENIDENQYLTNGFVDMENKNFENNTTLEDQTFDVDSPQLSSKVHTSQIKDTDLKEIANKSTKRESSPKKHAHSTLNDLLDNDNSPDKYNTVILEIVGNIQDVTAINNAASVKNTETIIDSSKAIASTSTSTCALKNDVETKQIGLSKDFCHKSDVPAHKKGNEILKNDSTINNTKKAYDHLENRHQLDAIVNGTPESPTADSIISRTDKFIVEESGKVDVIPRMSHMDVTSSTVLSITCDPSENNANGMLTLSTTTCLPKSSKINTDRNNTRETPELSLGQAAYLANSLSSERVEDNEISVLPGKKVNKTPNLAKASLDTTKKTNGVNVGESTFKNDLPRNGSPILETKQMTLLKGTTSEVRSNDDKIAKLASVTGEKVTNANNISPEKNVNLTKCQKNKLERIDEKNSLPLNLEKTSLPTSKIETKEIIVQSSAVSKKENLSQSTKTDIKKIGDIDVECKSTTNTEKNAPYKSKNVPKMAVNECSGVNLSEINKNSHASVATEIDNSKAKSAPQKVINTPRILKKSTSVNFPKSTNDNLSNMTLSDPKISQQSAPVDKKFTDKTVKETLKPPVFLDRVTEKKLTTIDTDTEELQQKDGQLSKSASTESIDFWSEIKTMDSPKWIKPKEREPIENRILDEATIISKVEGKEDLTSLKRTSNDLTSDKLPTVPIKEYNNKKIETDIKTGTVSGSIAVRSSDVEGETKKKIVSESSKVKAEDAKRTVPKIPLKKKNVSTGNNNLSSTVKRKAAVKQEDSASSIQSQSNLSGTMTPTSSESTSVSDITVPLINIVEAPKPPESEARNPNEENEDSSTPTNEPIDSSFSQILKWDNRNDLTKTNDTETPILSEEVSLANNPVDSVQSSRTKRVPKKKKPSTKKTASIKNEKERKESISESTSQQNTLLIKPNVDKQNLAKPSPKVSPKASPKKSSAPRPQDLIRMFYTTPSALLTATPRDLSKVRRAKIKRRRHHSRTPSVNSDSTGSTTSTATTDSTDGSGSTCTELEDDTVHKNSTRSNDSGFDGSPRISSTYFIIIFMLFEIPIPNVSGQFPNILFSDLLSI